VPGKIFLTEIMEDMNLSGIDSNDLSRDERFMQKIYGILQSNLDNEHLSVKDLAGEMAMSRIQLYRRIRKITGKNVSQFIREYRLEKAMDLLRKDVATVSEIAYGVGFGSPAYFNKCFHKYFGFPPGEALKKQAESFEGQLEMMSKFQAEKHKEDFTFNLRKVFRNTNFWIILSIIIGISAIILIIWYMSAINRLVDYSDDDSEKIRISPKSIAVLPFRNESPDLENEYFCNGMQDEILNHLQKIASLSVRSKTSVEQYRNTEKTMPIIGWEINAAYILEGSIWKLGENFRMSFQLIESESDEHLWGETYDVMYSDTIFQIQTYIAKRIATSLQVVLLSNEDRRMELRYTNNIESYDLSIRGAQEMDNYFRYWDKKHLRSALNMYNKALKIDPENIRALVGKADVHRFTGSKDSVLFYCNRGISIDPDYYFSYHVKAAYYNNILKYDLAIENYLITIELSPNNALAHSRLGEIYIIQKRDVMNGLIHLNKSLELNVTSQPYVFYWVGMCYTHVGDYEKAKENFIKMVQLEFNCDGIQMYSWCLAVQQKHMEAIDFLDSICLKADCKLICIREKWFHSYIGQEYERAEEYIQKYWEKGYKLEVHWKICLANMYLQMGREKDACLILDSCKIFYENNLDNWGETWYNTFNISQVYILLGEKEKGLKYLLKAVDIGMLGGWHDLLEVDPIYESFWAEPEFKAIVKRTKEERAALREQISETEEKTL
jgi:TolB-like protein/AraC-like DNA-binding protein/Tfp pilus assembly protein PilF